MGAFALSGPRRATARIVAFGSLFLFFLIVYTLFPSTPKKVWGSFSNAFGSRLRGSCSPQDWANGAWVPKKSLPSNATMTSESDALSMLGFEGCASSREYYWHLAADVPEQWDRFPGVASYEWKPPSTCTDVQPLDREGLVRDMVENGGWLLIGDSVTENHFFSLSCILYPHVLATPNYTALGRMERHWPQHLYLSPSSPLIKFLNPPPGFNLSTTPLVTFRRVDLLLSKEELVDLHRELHNPPSDFSLFSEETLWSLPPSEYLALFQQSLPEANYRTMVVSTAGHWTTTVMAGYRDESLKDDGYGIHGVLDFFREAMTKWADEIQTALTNDMGTAGHRVKREVVVRAYLPGHEDCHSWREPWAKYHPFKWSWYNWGYIKDFNRVFSEVTSSRSYPDIHYLPIDRPALLRPDAHAAGDCLHIMTGAGVLEGWTQYIWHYISREIPGRIR